MEALGNGIKIFQNCEEQKFPRQWFFPLTFCIHASLKFQSKISWEELALKNLSSFKLETYMN